MHMKAPKDTKKAREIAIEYDILVTILLKSKTLKIECSLMSESNDIDLAKV